MASSTARSQETGRAHMGWRKGRSSGLEWLTIFFEKSGIFLLTKIRPDYILPIAKKGKNALNRFDNLKI
jgi:hypothetical protein